jgi:acyl-CoA dehydrogenase
MLRARVSQSIKGISINKVKKICCHACAANEIFYDDVRVPKESLLGTLNNGWYDLLLTLNPERFLTAAISLVPCNIYKFG